MSFKKCEEEPLYPTLKQVTCLVLSPMVHNLFQPRGHSNTSDMAKCHKRVLKHKINILKHQIVFILFIVSLDCAELYSFFKK
jgi:hypothetical protein